MTKKVAIFLIKIAGLFLIKVSFTLSFTNFCESIKYISNKYGSYRELVSFSIKLQSVNVSCDTTLQKVCLYQLSLNTFCGGTSIHINITHLPRARNLFRNV